MATPDDIYDGKLRAQARAAAAKKAAEDKAAADKAARDAATAYQKANPPTKSYNERVIDAIKGGKQATTDVNANPISAYTNKPAKDPKDPVDPPVDPDPLSPDIDGVLAGLTSIIAGLTDKLNQAPAVRLITQKTVRKTGGTVQTVNVMSDGTETVVDEYKDYSARDAVMEMFNNTGLESAFMTSLLNSVDQVYTDNIAPTDAQILNSIYNSEAYKTRFAANETIRQRIADGKGRPGDRLLKPAEYIETENTYREIMSSAGLPQGFFDNQDDFSNLIANGISASELTSRVNIAQKALQSADQEIVKSLKDYYGMSTGEMTAYLLDKDKAFNLIEGKYKYTTAEAAKMYGAAEIGGAALRAGETGSMADKAFAEEIYAAGKGGAAEEAFQGAAASQKDYKRLLSLYGETGTDQDLARQALALTGGAEVGIKTKKLASKERAKFQQRGAIDATSLGRRGKVADV